MPDTPNDDLSTPRSYMFRALTPEQAVPIAMAQAREKPAAEHHLVVLGRQTAAITEATVGSLAKGLGIDTYSARQRLMTPCPRVIRREDNQREAERWVGWLRALELVAYTVPEATLRAFDPMLIRTFVAEPAAVVFVLEDGAMRRTARREIVCVVTGTVRERIMRETTSSPTGSGAPATALTTAYEVSSHREELIADVHVLGQDAPLRLNEALLDTRSLFADRQVPSLTHMAEAVRMLRIAVGGVPVFDQFDAASGALGDNWQVLARSTDLMRRRMTAGAASLQLTTSTLVGQSDRASFDLYSHLLRLQLLLG